MAARSSFETAYPKLSWLRLTLDMACLDMFRSNFQNTHTKAVPRATTIPRNSNVNPGAVSMFNIPDAMQAAYQ